jgi:hypothetical protein
MASARAWASLRKLAILRSNCVRKALSFDIVQIKRRRGRRSSAVLRIKGAARTCLRRPLKHVYAAVASSDQALAAARLLRGARGRPSRSVHLVSGSTSA